MMCAKTVLPALLALCLLATPGCYEPQEGCLDVDATNFDASADENCCCEYPNLHILTAQVYDTLQYLENRIYYSDSGPFRLYNIVYYLSEMELTQNGVPYQVSDSLSFLSYGTSATDTVKQVLTDDYILIRRSSLDNESGTFRPTGTFDKVKMRLGLPVAANKIIPSKTPAGHVLRPQAEDLWLGPDRGYAYARVVVAADTALAAIPDTIYFSSSDLPNVFFESTGTFYHQPGYDFKVTLKADYYKVFKEVNWQAAPDTRKVTIRDNFSKAFTISQ